MMFEIIILLFISIIFTINTICMLREKNSTIILCNIPSTAFYLFFCYLLHKNWESVVNHDVVFKSDMNIIKLSFIISLIIGLCTIAFCDKKKFPAKILLPLFCNSYALAFTVVVEMSSTSYNIAEFIFIVWFNIILIKYICKSLKLTKVTNCTTK